jgi:DNA gyrase subunit A
MIKKIAELINDKKLDGISYIMDESDRNGIRVVIICKKEAQANVGLNNLYKYTQLQTSFNVNNIALFTADRDSFLSNNALNISLSTGLK